jgi:TolB-like protein
MKLLKCVVAAGLLLGAVAPPGAAQQPTLAVLDLNDGGSLGPDAQNLTGLGKGIAAMLTTEMSRNPRVRMVERDRIRALLDEQRLAVSGMADQSSAIQVGRLLGAQYMLFGSYTDVYGQLRMDVRVVEVETGRLVRAQEITAPRENLLASVAMLAERTFRDLSLTPPTAMAPVGRVPAAAAIAFSRGLAMEDARDASGARAQYQEALRLASDYAAARQRLDRLNGPGAPASASRPAQEPPPAPAATATGSPSMPARQGSAAATVAAARTWTMARPTRVGGRLAPLESAAMLDAELPRVLVLVGSREDGVSDMLGEFLREGGFMVVDPAFARTAADRERLSRALAGSDPDAVDLGRALGAHVVVLGAAPSDAGQAEPGLVTGTAELNVRALRLDRGQAVATARASGRGVDATAGAAKAKALRAAVDALTRTGPFVGQLINDWRTQPWDQRAYWAPESTSVAGQLTTGAASVAQGAPTTLAIVEAASYPDTASGRRGLGVVGRVPMRARVRGIVPATTAEVTVAGVAARVRPVTAEERARFGLQREGVFFEGQAPLAPDQDTVRVRALAGGASSEAVVRTGTGRRWAVVIGISRYADPAIPALQYAEADARAMHQFLRSPQGGAVPQERIRLLVNEQATTAAIRDALFSFLQQAGPDDQVTVYVATHGAPDPARPANLYILSHDTDVRRMAATAFPMWDFQTAVRRQIAAQRVVVIADACHSAGTLVEDASALNEAWDALFNPSMRMTLSAARGNEYSREGAQWGGGHGVFTHTLLEGLRGQADTDRDGVVTFTEAALWVERSVPQQTGGEQHPQRSGLGDVAMSWINPQPTR